MENQTEIEQLNELKQNIISTFVTLSMNWNEWDKFMKRKTPKWIDEKGIEVLMSEEIIEQMQDLKFEKVMQIFKYFTANATTTSKLQSLFAEMLKSLSNKLTAAPMNWMVHRTMCRVIVILADREQLCSDKLFSQIVIYQWNKYMLNLLVKCTNMETLLWTVFSVERVALQMELNSEMKTRLCNELIKLPKCDYEAPSNMNNSHQCLEYQVGWCARWCIDNILGDKSTKLMPWVKVSTDGFGARNDYITVTKYFPPVRSAFSINVNGVFFYEAILATRGKFRFEWTTNETRLFALDGWMEHKHSIALEIDGYIGNLYHNGNKYSISGTSPWHAGDIVGCLIDLNQKRALFYQNGTKIAFPAKMNFSILSYFATVSLAINQQCYFNFGQMPFKFAPKYVQFKSFADYNAKDERKFKLMQTVKDVAGYFWFKHFPVNNKVDLFYQDETQQEFDDTIREIEKTIQNEGEIKDLHLEYDDPAELFKGIGYLQSIVEVMGHEIEDNKMDIMAKWIGDFIKHNIDKMYKLREKLLEFIYPYLHLRVESHYSKHRTICIVLLHLIQHCQHHKYDLIEYIRSEVFVYLNRTLTDTVDKWTQMFVLIGLEGMGLNEQEKTYVKKNFEIVRLVKCWKESFEQKNLFAMFNMKHIFNKLELNYQLCSTAARFYSHVLFLPYDSTSLVKDTQATLNPLDKSDHLRLSINLLSSRSDWNWQSVRSVCGVISGMYYFEVVLLTGGPMRIGWATKRTELNQFVVGSDEFSIGFNGYSRRIWFDDKSYEIANIYRWQVGDVIGCSIDATKHQFGFTLNGQQLDLPPNLYFSALPYHASVSLSPHQQCYFNFGQTSFKYRPKQTDIHDFHSFPPLTHTSASISIVNSQLENVFLSNNATNTTGDITFTASTKTSNNVMINAQFANVIPAECKLCYEPSPSTLLRFVCCDTLSFCRDCVEQVKNCPKCVKRGVKKLI